MRPPGVVQIEVSTCCNIHCRFCQSTPHPTPSLMEWALFERCLDFVSRGCWVELFGNGEPLLHPRFVDMTSAVRERGGLPRTSTNGMLMSPEMIRSLEAAGLQRATFSICGATAELHEWLQQGIVSEQVWSNFAACAKSRIQAWALYVLMRSNLAALGAFVQRVHASGGRYVVIEQIYVSDNHPLVGEQLRYHREALRRYLPQAETLAESLGVTVERRYDASLLLGHEAHCPDSHKPI